jgi:hypothetical protein
MDIIKEGKALGTAISRAVSALKSMQDRVHMLVVSSMWHYYEHGDSTYLTKLAAGVTKCDGVRKERLIGYITESCGLNWDQKNGRFKKAKDSTFTKGSEGNPDFPLDRLSAERWYEFESGDEVPAWLLKKVLRQANKAISNNSDDAKLQVVDAWAEYEALQTTMKEVGLGRPALEEVA